MRVHILVALLTAPCLVVHSRGKILRNNALMTKMISHFQQDNNLSVEPHRKKDNDNFSADQKQDRDYQKQDRETYQKPDYQKQDYQKQDYQKQDYQKQDYQKQDYQKQDYQKQDYQKQDYQKQEERSYQRQDISPDNQKPEKILNLMQNVLCRNFPSIPCKIIMQDDALNKLIQRSIQQITYKKLRMEHTTQPQPNAPTLYPIINSEDLSNFLEVSNTGYFDEKANGQKSKKKKRVGAEKKMKNHWSHEKPSKKKIKGSKDTKHGTEMYSGRKKMRKFYPHKIKYKDKTNKNRAEFRDYDEEKMSMSIELPDLEVKAGTKGDHMTYKVEPENSPVWRIDYMKHGIPSLNMFGYEDERLRGKIIKSGPNVIVDENGLEQPVLRKEVLHPDVYIKKNFVRKNTMTDDNLE